MATKWALTEAATLNGTKLGLKFDDAATRALEDWISARSRRADRRANSGSNWPAQTPYHRSYCANDAACYASIGINMFQHSLPFVKGVTKKPLAMLNSFVYLCSDSGESHCF